MNRLFAASAALALLALSSAGAAFAGDVSISVTEGTGSKVGGVACTGLGGEAAKCSKTALVDSGGADLSDPSLHGLKITCLLGCTAPNLSVGTIGSTAPGYAAQIGGFDASGLMQGFRVETGAPGASDPGLAIWGYQLGANGPLYQAISQPASPQASTGVDIGAVENNVNMGNAQVQMHVCGSQATVNPSTATDTQLVAPVSGKNIYVCGVEISSNGTNNVNLESATAASCGGTLTAIGTTWYTTQFFAKIAADFVYRGKNTGASNGLCVHTTAAQNVSVTAYYDQY